MSKSTEKAESTLALRNVDDRLRYSIDQVKLAVAELPKPSAEPILWLFRLAKENEWSSAQTGKRIGYSSTTVSRLFGGKYEAKNLAPLLGAIKAFRRSYEQGASTGDFPFIETSFVRRVWQGCSFALATHSVVFLWGESQIGKTCALQEFRRRNNHGITTYVRLPASGGILMVAQEIARATGLSPNSCFTKLRERLMRSLDDSNLLIIDEAHQAFLTYQKNSSVKVLEFIREIHDRTGCGLVLCGTNVWRDEIEGGPMAKVLAQLRRRGVAHIQLEDRPKPSDLLKFYAAFSLPKPENRAAEIAEDVVHSHGLGKLLKLLQAASRRAEKHEREIDWSDFIAAHDTLRLLSARRPARR